MTNTLAYRVNKLIIAVRIFIVQGPENMLAS
jgi:hypothetical protein